MLSQQEIEAILQSTSKHRSATADEVKHLKSYIQNLFFEVSAVSNVKVIAETNDSLSFSFQREISQPTQLVSDNYFITIEKSSKAEDFK